MGTVIRRSASPASLYRYQQLSNRTADEAGPDEHGGVDRKPRSVPRSSFSGIHGAHSRRRADQRHGREVHPEASSRRSSASRHHLPPKDGISDALGLLARGSAAATDRNPVDGAASREPRTVPARNNCADFCRTSLWTPRPWQSYLAPAES